MIGNRKPWRCPRCGKMTTDYPNLSRIDNKTDICENCGTSEALLDWKGQLMPKKTVVKPHTRKTTKGKTIVKKHTRKTTKSVKELSLKELGDEFKKLKYKQNKSIAQKKRLFIVICEFRARGFPAELPR